MTVFPSVQSSYGRSICAPALLMFGAFFPGSFSRVGAQPPSPVTTFVVFAEHKLGVSEWVALNSEVERSQAEFSAQVPRLGKQVEVLRGEDVAPGAKVQSAITVYLHGECTLMPSTKHVVEGALGWIPVVEGRIQPFIHVNCDRIVEMLGPLALGMHRERRETVMAEAITRVILHEWIHFAAQTTRHVERGVTKSQFLVSDLLADDVEYQPHQRGHRERKRQSGM